MDHVGGFLYMEEETYLEITLYIAEIWAPCGFGYLLTMGV